LNREPHVFERAELREKVGELERPAEAFARPRGRRQSGDVLALHQHRSGARRQLPRDQVEVGGLAGAVRAHDGREAARGEAARDVIDGHVPAEANGEPARFERGRRIRVV
jgi:hypothetical protein